MQMFQGFKPEGMKKIQQRMGYTGPADQFQSYLQANPDKQMMMNSYVNKAMNMASGGYVRKFNTGGFALPPGFDSATYLEANPDVIQGIQRGEFTSAEDHFQKFGGGEIERAGKVALPDNFDGYTYIRQNPDLAADFKTKTGIDPFGQNVPISATDAYAKEHFTKFGFQEDRNIPTGIPDQTEVRTGTPITALPDARDEVTQSPPPADTQPSPPVDTQPSPPADTQPPPDPNAGLTPEQIHRRNFYASTPEEQAAINARFPFFTLPVGPTDTGAPAVDNTQPATDTTQPPAAGTGANFTPPEEIRFPLPPNFNAEDYLSANQDVLVAINFGQFNSAEDHYQRFGGGEDRPGVPTTGTTTDGQTVSQGPLPSWLTPPPAGSTNTQGLVTYTNPLTGETYTTATGGYSVNVGGTTTPTTPTTSATVNGVVYLQNRPDVLNAINEGELFGVDPATLEGLTPQQRNQILAQAHFNIFGAGERVNPSTGETLPQSPYEGLTSIADISAARLETPVLADGTRLDAQTIAGPDGAIPTGTDVSTTTSQLSVTDPTATAGTAATPTGATAGTQDPTATTTVSGTTKTVDDVKTVTDATKGRTLDFTLGADGKERAIPKAAQATAEDTLFEGANLQGETDTATDAVAATRADITDPEKLRETVVRDEAKNFVEGIVAASADPSGNATVAGQLANLLADFTLSDPPAWAAGAVRFATAEMARRGLGTSSMAGQAIVQAAMEAALPIAQADAQIQAQFEGQNLSNKQQMAMFYAQQRANFIGKEFDQEFQANVANTARISEIADLNFNAQQQVVLENSRATNTMNLNNLSNKQAILMAEAATLSQLDMANLNNRQQAAVQSAQAFLQKDMTDVSNEQQTTLFNAQQRIQSFFTDTAAENARKQFNASSESQTEQFFANLSTQVSQFNDAQKNAIAQFNAGQQGTVSRFNAEIENQRDQFNAQNRLVIDQANAVWRRQIATADTAAQNRVNELNASALLDISDTAYSDLWQQYSDMIEFAYTSAENELDRIASLAEANINADTRRDIADEASSTAAGSAIGNLVGTLGAAFIGKVL